MDSPYTELLLIIFGGIVGECIGVIFNRIRNNWKTLGFIDISGKWKSVYKPDFRGDEKLIIEEINIKRKSGKIYMENFNHPTNDNYIVNADLIDKAYLAGQWISTIPGANASGAIMLTISPLGNIMYGYFTGLGNTGERTYCGWIMARNEEDLYKGVDLLKNLSFVFLQDDRIELNEKTKDSA